MNKKTSAKETKTSAQLTARTNGVALTLAMLFYAAAVAGAAALDSDGLSDTWIAIFVIVMALLGTNLLLALKIASQWEKAVVLSGMVSLAQNTSIQEQ